MLAAHQCAAGEGAGGVTLRISGTMRVAITNATMAARKASAKASVAGRILWSARSISPQSPVPLISMQPARSVRKLEIRLLGRKLRSTS